MENINVHNITQLQYEYLNKTFPKIEALKGFHDIILINYNKLNKSKQQNNIILIIPTTTKNWTNGTIRLNVLSALHTIFILV